MQGDRPLRYLGTATSSTKFSTLQVLVPPRVATVTTSISGFEYLLEGRTSQRSGKVLAELLDRNWQRVVDLYSLQNLLVPVQAVMFSVPLNTLLLHVLAFGLIYRIKVLRRNTSTTV